MTTDGGRAKAEAELQKRREDRRVSRLSERRGRKRHRPTDRHLVGAEAAARAGRRRGGAALVVVVEGDDDDDVGQVVGVAVELDLF